MTSCFVLKPQLGSHLTCHAHSTKAPRIDFVRTFADTDDNTVVMDMKVSFTPNDVHDLTPRQLEGKVNPKIVLAIRFGKGVATLGKDVVVEDISFSGLLRFRFKLMSNFPNVKTVEFSFMEKPVIDFVLKPIGFDLSLVWTCFATGPGCIVLRLIVAVGGPSDPRTGQLHRQPGARQHGSYDVRPQLICHR